jgi:hypothetical protein
MPVIGHGDQRGVDFLEVEHLAVIVESFGVGRCLFGLIELHIVDVAQRDYIHVAGLEEVAHVAAASLAAADESKLNAVVGSQDAGVRKGGGSRDGAQKGAPRDVVVGHKRIVPPPAPR